MNKYWQLLTRVTIFFICIELSACQVTPSGNLNVYAPELNFSTLHTKNFDLLIATNNVVSKNLLHVYIEGDGTPWVNRYFIAKDPGPYGRLSLDLMRQDANSSLYLGRPCYYSWRLPPQDNCAPLLWTDARYSEIVVESMSAALSDYLHTHPYKKIILIGHSGGGTLAYLIAQRVESVAGLIILSGNLDTDAWTRHHHYSRLRRSLNPASLPVHKKMPVIYLAGEKDEVVPPRINKSFLEKINAKIITRPDYDHVCCWRNEWASLISGLSSDL